MSRKNNIIVLSAALFICIITAAAVIFSDLISKKESTPMPEVRIINADAKRQYHQLSEEQIQSMLDAAYEEYERRKAEGFEAVDPDTVLAQGETVTLNTGDFMQYKYQFEALRHFNENVFQEQVANKIMKTIYGTFVNTVQIDNEDLLRQYLRYHVIAEHAKELGLTVSQQELDEFIAATKQNLNDTSSNAANDTATLVTLMSKMNGWTEEQYWETPQVREGYERILLEEKLQQHLMETGQANNRKDMETYEDNVLNTAIRQMNIDWELLNSIP